MHEAGAKGMLKHFKIGSLSDFPNGSTPFFEKSKLLFAGLPPVCIVQSVAQIVHNYEAKKYSIENIFRDWKPIK